MAGIKGKSGRKPKLDKKIDINTSLEPHVFEQLEKDKVKHDITRSQMAAKIIKEYYYYV